MNMHGLIQTDATNDIVFYLTTYDWISFLKITIERRAIYGNLENADDR